MAVQLITKIQEWTGTSSDTKPSIEVPIGSKFHETDTLKTYVYTVTGWAESVSNILLDLDRWGIDGDPTNNSNGINNALAWAYQNNFSEGIYS